MLLIDLSKAFDYAGREVIMGWMPSMSAEPIAVKAEFLRSLGVDLDAGTELAEWIDHTGGLLLSSGADPAVCALVASLHNNSWFKLPNDQKFLVSISGGRQGCKLGAPVFNLIYSVARKRVREDLGKHNIVLLVRARTNMQFWDGRWYGLHVGSLAAT